MSKDGRDPNSDLKAMIQPTESILYEGKPNKKCYIFECIFNPMLFIALIWGALDAFFISNIISELEQGMGYFMLFFFAIHLMPVWLYLGGVLLMFRRYRNTYYIVTDYAIYVSGGVFVRNYKSKPFAELSHINLHRGIFDQWFKVGDVIATSSQFEYEGYSSTAYSNQGVRSAALKLESIEDYDKVFQLISKLQKDIYTDTQFPNKLRPSENEGYNTKWKGEQ